MTNSIKPRAAVCFCGRVAPAGTTGLAFREDRGPGSRWATEGCGECGMNYIVHQPINPSTGRPGVTNHEFTPRGPAEMDTYYCGCRGWD